MKPHPTLSPEQTPGKHPKPPRSRRDRLGETFACPHGSCSEVFRRPGDLKKHEKKHTLPYGCELCPRRFYQLRDLKKHSRTHSGGPIWPCPFNGCDGKFTVDDNLVRHIKQKHNQVVKKSSLQPVQPA